MVRAGVVSHPAQWSACGYREIQDPPKRYGINDLPVLMDLLGFSDLRQLQRTHAQWVEEALQANLQRREGYWSESLAVGSHVFVQDVKAQLGIGGRYREVVQDSEAYRLMEPSIAYNTDFDPEMVTLSTEKTVFSK